MHKGKLGIAPGRLILPKSSPAAAVNMEMAGLFNHGKKSKTVTRFTEKQRLHEARRQGDLMGLFQGPATPIIEAPQVQRLIKPPLPFENFKSIDGDSSPNDFVINNNPSALDDEQETTHNLHLDLNTSGIGEVKNESLSIPIPPRKKAKKCLEFHPTSSSTFQTSPNPQPEPEFQSPAVDPQDSQECHCTDCLALNQPNPCDCIDCQPNPQANFFQYDPNYPLCFDANFA